MADMLSVGIDIGTTTTQVIFSRLQLENTASYFSAPNVSITDKKVVYRGVVHLTPFKSPQMIDSSAVRSIVEADFRAAGFTPQDTGTGAVIITGEAAHTENAEKIITMLSGFAGDFVVTTAGPDLEAVLAGKGSGASQYSSDNNCTVANLDIGGGTTNIAVFEDGEAAASSCLSIGGRLIRLDIDMTVLYAAPPALQVAEDQRISLIPGRRLEQGDLAVITKRMNTLLEEEMGLTPRSALLEKVRTSGSGRLLPGNPVRNLKFSGGVAEYIYGEQNANLLQYGDIGVSLGRAVAAGRLASQCRVIGGGETIRATVIGAGSYATAVSGSTITIAPDRFPVKSIPVLYIANTAEGESLLDDPIRLADKIKWFQTQSSREDVALGFEGEVNPAYGRLEKLAATLCRAIEGTIPDKHPAIIVVERDIAKALGQAMRRIAGRGRDIICIDGVKVSQGDYIDLGKPLMDDMVVPVVVKTLIFG